MKEALDASQNFTEQDRVSDMNAFHLTGQLTRTPELKTSGGQMLARLGLAVKNHRANDGVEYINVTVFGGLASACVKHLTKGQFVEIDGRMTSVWYTLEGGEELERSLEDMLGASPEEEAQHESEDKGPGVEWPGLLRKLGFRRGNGE